MTPLLLTRRHVHDVRDGLHGRVVDDDDWRRYDDGHQPDDGEDHGDSTPGEQQSGLHRPHDGVQSVDADDEQREHAHAHRDAFNERCQFAHDDAVHPIAVDVGRQCERHPNDDDEQVADSQVHQEHVRLCAHMRMVDDDGDDEQVAKETDDEGDRVESDE